MAIAALLTWIATAGGGFYMLATWLQRGGMEQSKNGGSHLPVPVIFGHFGLAATGLVVWIIYLFADSAALAWTAFVLLLPVAALGFLMLARWLPVHQGRVAPATPAAAAPGPVGQTEPAEKHFPVAVVAAHGLFAVVTLILVLITAIAD